MLIIDIIDHPIYRHDILIQSCSSRFSNMVEFKFCRRLSFLPDPKDGSLYALSDGREGIKKLPFTIPQLVTASPCKSNEGILYTGKPFVCEIYLMILLYNNKDTLHLKVH